MNIKRRPYVKKREIERKFNYHSTRWRILREQVLKENNYICISCKQEGRITKANVVDHIKPIKSGGDPYNTSNLQTLCESCHAKKSASEVRR